MKLHDQSNLALVLSALSMLVAASAQAGPELHHPEKPTYDYEKCFAIARAGHNDCFTQSNSCGGSSRMDQQGDAWIYLPRGTCEKITGGSLKPVES